VKCKYSLISANIENLYDVLGVNIIPAKAKVAMYLVNQFEKDGFNFKVAYDEERLQKKYEDLAYKEI